MKPSLCSNLGAVVAAINKAHDDLNDDPMNDYAGFTPDPTPHLEEMARQHGFANTTHLYAVVKQRTSAKWAYHNCRF